MATAETPRSPNGTPPEPRRHVPHRAAGPTALPDTTPQTAAGKVSLHFSMSLDEIDPHVAPVLLGDGVRLFDDPGGVPLRLELLNGANRTAEVNLRYHPVANK